MPVIPNPISFRYKKHLSVPSERITVTTLEPADYMQVLSKPDWLNIIYHGVYYDSTGNPESHDFKVEVNPASANNLAPGFHTATVRFTGTSSGGAAKVGKDTFLTVNLEVIDNIVLTISKSSYLFEHTLGSTNPSVQPLTISTERAWSIVADQAWLTFSQNNGTSTATIDLGVQVSGMEVGAYEATFQVDDGQSIKQGKVTLMISGAEDSGDYLDLSRTTLSFSEVFQQAPSRSASLQVKTSLPATVSTAAPWLNLSAVNLDPGTHDLTIATVATEGLSIGNYTGSITIESGFAVKNVSLLLRIVDVQSSGIETGKLYFAADRNTLVLTSTTPNAEALIEFNTPVLNYSRRVPFFRDLAQVIIGLETQSLLKPTPLPQVFQSGAFSPVVPLAMDFTVYDKVLNSTALTERQSFAAVKFLNGRTPDKENILTEIPTTVTVPADGLICFNFYSETSISQATLTGAVASSVTFSAIDSNVYTVLVDLSEFTLVSGDRIQISAGPINLNVVIQPTDLDTFRLVWLNQWDCPEVMNMSGAIEISDEDDSTVVTIAEAGREIDRVVEIREPRSFKVGTGNIYSDAEVKWLSGMLRSKKVWLEVNGSRTEVIRKTRSISTFQTRQNIKQFTLNFDAAVR